MSLAKEFTVCPDCGCVIANEDMHATYHAWVQETIIRVNQMLTVVWEDAKLDKSKKLEPLQPPPRIDY
jgi:hypothetical protein